MKLNRNFRLLIETVNKEIIEIKSPFTIQFDIERTSASSVNQMNLRIFNLSQKTRNLLFKERFLILDDSTQKYYRKIILQAGYNELSTIFKGNILECYSYRQGSEIITYLNCHDGGYAISNSYSSVTFDKSETYSSIFEKLATDLTGIKKGKIGEIEGKPKRGSVFNGNTFTLLQESFNNKIFIDLEKINLLNENEAIKGDVPLINAQAGLLGTPMRQGTYLKVDIIFEPRIVVGQIIEINSKINPIYNGQFKVDGIKHAGTISGAVGGECKTSLDLFMGTEILQNLKIL